MQNTGEMPLLARTLKNQERIRVLEEQVNQLYKQHKNLLENVRELVEIIAENQEE
tara:strand:- start:1367 stop:1531 length:165 start_codon:yes stop_codon:yes gene_type:complete